MTDYTVYRDGENTAKNDIHIRNINQALNELNISRSSKGGELRRKAANNPFLKEVADVYTVLSATEKAEQRRINKCLHNLAYKHLASIAKENANGNDRSKRILDEIRRDKKILESELNKRKR